MPVPLRVGFAGANVARGWARDAHFPALSTLPGLVIKAVSARTRDIAEAAAQAFGAARAYDDSLALARDPDAEIVAVTVKVPEHRQIVLAALDAGKHVYCEWPLARDLDEAEELAAAARRAGTHVAIGLQGANSLAVRRAAQLVRDGAIGSLLNLRVVSSTAGWGTQAPPHYAYLQDRRNGATLTTIAGGHTLAMIEAVVGSFTEVSARNSILHRKVAIAGINEVVDRTCPDHIVIHGLHETGCISNVEIIGGEHLPLRFELRGTLGTLEIQGSHPGGYQCGALHVVTPLTSPGSDAVLADNATGPAVNVGEMWRRFEQDIRSGERTIPDFEQAVRLTKLLDAIDQSASEGKTVKPDTPAYNTN